MNKYDVVIGIEIHIELNTKTKMFSPSLNKFGDKPNTLIHPIDLGYPGTLPRVNKEAVRSGIKLAKVLQMKIDPDLRFDRKHYFYPDLPKGFQITQQFHPIGRDGKLPIKVQNREFEVNLERIHLEEDTANQIHKNNRTLINYNRAGVPLIEVVTRPCMSSAEEAVNYVKMLRLTALYLNISDARMEEGSLRTDINISLKPKGSKTLGSKVEIKNLNSLSNVKKAIQWEIKHQSELLDKNQKVLSKTKRFDETKQQNVVMRDKTTVIDYRYFPEPNIPTIKLSKKFIEDVKIGEMPFEKQKRYSKLGLSEKYIDQLVNNPELASYFDSVKSQDFKKTSNIIFAEIVSYINKNNLSLDKISLKPEQLKELVDDPKINSKQCKQIIKDVLSNKSKFRQAIKQHTANQINDEAQLIEIINKIIASIDGIKKSYQDRPQRVQKLVMGQLMKQTRGQANPILAMKLVKKALSGI